MLQSAQKHLETKASFDTWSTREITGGLSAATLDNREMYCSKTFFFPFSCIWFLQNYSIIIIFNTSFGYITQVFQRFNEVNSEWKECTLDLLNWGKSLSSEMAEPVNITYKHLKTHSAAKVNLHQSPGLHIPLQGPTACWTKCAN